MKKIILLILIFLCNIKNVYAISSIDFARSKGNIIDDKYAPAGSIIVEPNTGTILWSENIDTKWRPASMSKLMTILLAYDAIKEGKFSLDTKVNVTNKYIDISKNPNLSNNKMKLGCTYTVADLIDLIIVPSSAAATYMLADMINPNRYEFVKMLNDRAKSLGMKNTVYSNPIGVINKLLNGLAVTSSWNDDNYTTSYDYAILCSYLINNYKDLLNHTRNKTISVGTGYCKETFTGYNHSLPGTRHAFGGADGIKTGSAGYGYNYSMTAKRGDTRLVEIVLGVGRWEYKESEYIRHIIGNAILEEAFSKYEYKKVVSKGRIFLNNKEIEVEDDLYDIVPKDGNFEVVYEGGVYIKYNRVFLNNGKPKKVKAKVIKINTYNKTYDIAYITLILVIISAILYLTRRTNDGR